MTINKFNAQEISKKIMDNPELKEKFDRENDTTIERIHNLTKVNLLETHQRIALAKFWMLNNKK